jgi:2-hydroxy-3-keto-5-methylthiopentenyl-1-phosphate phosphatase
MKENQIIAEFMGVVFLDDENQFYIEDGLYVGNTLQYHTSWDWLMPVVEKINLQVTLGYATGNIHKVIDKIHHAVKYTMIDATYKAVVEFIKKLKQE